MQSFSIAKSWWQFLIMAIVSYALGCVNIARIIARNKHKDIKTMGSGNPGTLNMSREFGWKVGLITFLFDAVKGAISVFVAHLIYKEYAFEGTQVCVSDVARYFCGLCAILGHIFPVIYRFEGGKGIATTFGVFWVGLSCESGWFALVVLGMVFGVLAFIFITEWGSLGNLLAMAVFSIMQLIVFIFRYQAQPLNAFIVIAYMLVLSFTLVTWYAHKKNLLRLFGGEEHRTSLKKIFKKK